MSSSAYSNSLVPQIIMQQYQNNNDLGESLGNFGASLVNLKNRYDQQEQQDQQQQAMAQYQDQLGQLLNQDPQAAYQFAQANGDSQTANSILQLMKQQENKRQFDQNMALKQQEQAGKASGSGGKDFEKIASFKFWQELKRQGRDEEAKAYGQANGFVTKEGRELSAKMQDIHYNALDKAEKSRTAEARLNSIAESLSKTDYQGGVKGSVFETLKSITGSQDIKTELRKKVFGIRAKEVVKNLPPGAASDPDVQMAKSGFPDDTANKETWMSFLRGTAKLERVVAKYEEAKVDYIDENGSLRGFQQFWRKESKKKDYFDQAENDNTSTKSASQYREGQTATNGAGDKIIFRNGQWQQM
ncbi:hypothetical protein [uncultured Mediterranean phage uvMED]|nr:hypothetical protein [uncultured Mediterranean phage uvMED]